MHHKRRITSELCTCCNRQMSFSPTISKYSILHHRKTCCCCSVSAGKEQQHKGTVPNDSPQFCPAPMNGAAHLATQIIVVHSIYKTRQKQWQRAQLPPKCFPCLWSQLSLPESKLQAIQFAHRGNVHTLWIAKQMQKSKLKLCCTPTKMSKHAIQCVKQQPLSISCSRIPPCALFLLHYPSISTMLCHMDRPTIQTTPSAEFMLSSHSASSTVDVHEQFQEQAFEHIHFSA